MMTCVLLRQSVSHSRQLAADTQCLWLLLCYHFSSLYPWPQSHMQVISVELLLAENDFMSDLLEKERGGWGWKMIALKQCALTKKKGIVRFDAPEERAFLHLQWFSMKFAQTLSASQHRRFTSTLCSPPPSALLHPLHPLSIHTGWELWSQV